MPVGIGAVAELSDHTEEYVAWSWAVNGFFSVIGSVLTTILAMTFGFDTVLVVALLIYLVALAALYRLLGPAPAATAQTDSGAGSGPGSQACRAWRARRRSWARSHFR